MRFSVIFLVFLICGVCEGFAAKNKDPCMDKLDRGKYCAPMSNNFYYNRSLKKCKGFHYTGCGNSNNNFKTLEECQTRCEKKIQAGPNYMF